MGKDSADVIDDSERGSEVEEAAPVSLITLTDVCVVGFRECGSILTDVLVEFVASVVTGVMGVLDDKTVEEDEGECGLTLLIDDDNDGDVAISAAIC